VAVAVAVVAAATKSNKKVQVEQKAIPATQEEDPCCPKGDEKNKKKFCYWGTSGGKSNRRGCPIRFDGPWPCSKCPKCEWKTKKGQCFLVGQGPPGPISTPAEKPTRKKSYADAVKYGR